ncbi:hypothetical protein RAS1_28540 [Phycisphaerae bacterium RAS1]|nr:hypothetical protein RAS1_28540 [Phycisphaerae bacterium RAS1]
MQQWRKLSHAMTRKEVRKLLGEPLRIDAPPPGANPEAPASGQVETWMYEYASVADGTIHKSVGGSVFISVAESRVAGWTEPDFSLLR